MRGPCPARPRPGQPPRPAASARLVTPVLPSRLTVSRLVRVGFGPIGLPNRLKRGQFYELNPAEVANIIKWADMLLPGERRRKKS
mgnify:CR=1 FL=1